MQSARYCSAKRQNNREIYMKSFVKKKQKRSSLAGLLKSTDGGFFLTPMIKYPEKPCHNSPRKSTVFVTVVSVISQDSPLMLHALTWPLSPRACVQVTSRRCAGTRRRGCCSRGARTTPSSCGTLEGARARPSNCRDTSEHPDTEPLSDLPLVKLHSPGQKKSHILFFCHQSKTKKKPDDTSILCL